MKRTILLIAILFFTTLFSYGQIKSKATIGISLTDVSKTPTGESKAKPGLQLGSSFIFGDRIYFEPGIFYSVKSTEFSTSGSSVAEETVIRGFRVPVGLGIRLLGDEETTANLRAFGGAGELI
jgi:hypothetical protein